MLRVVGLGAVYKVTLAIKLDSATFASRATDTDASKLNQLLLTNWPATSARLLLFASDDSQCELKPARLLIDNPNSTVSFKLVLRQCSAAKASAELEAYALVDGKSKPLLASSINVPLVN